MCRRIDQPLAKFEKRTAELPRGSRIFTRRVVIATASRERDGAFRPLPGARVPIATERHLPDRSTTFDEKSRTRQPFS
jgi:hypothetical protein